LNILNTLPNHGETPMFLTTRASGTPPLRSDLVVNLPKGAIDDLTSLSIGILKLKNHQR
jgi:hypothetical protein